jgi:hypothetical protein
MAKIGKFWTGKFDDRKINVIPLVDYWQQKAMRLERVDPNKFFKGLKAEIMRFNTYASHMHHDFINP